MQWSGRCTLETLYFLITDSYIIIFICRLKLRHVLAWIVNRLVHNHPHNHQRLCRFQSVVLTVMPSSCWSCFSLDRSCFWWVFVYSRQNDRSVSVTVVFENIFKDTKTIAAAPILRLNFKRFSVFLSYNGMLWIVLFDSPIILIDIIPFIGM